MNGYMGQLLAVDLTKEKISEIPLDRGIAKQFLGGAGYACRLLYDMMDASCDPLSPDNMLVFMTGPLTGTMAPCTGRHVVCGKSPLTGYWGESHSGGHFGAHLKFSGYDGLVIKGRAKNPVVLHIDEGSSTFLPGDDLWGTTTGVTQDSLRKDLGPVKVVCIGPAGENLVLYASIMNAERAAARCGLGAVMGSKNLKAIAVGGSKEIALSDAAEFTEITKKSSAILREMMSNLSKSGTAMYVDIAMMFNDMPIKYFREVDFKSDLINDKALDEILTGRIACYSCPIGCGRKVSLPEHNLKNIGGPEYQTIASLGSNLLISDIRAIAVMNRLCNQYGLDTISTGGTLALAISLQELGKLDYSLEWGDSDRAIELIHAIANRDGFGNELAEGSMRLAAKYGAEDAALHVKGLEIPGHDPRAFAGMATVYAVAARGASHLEGDIYSIDMGADVRDLGIVASDRLDDENKGVTAAKAQDYRAFFDSVIMCHFAFVLPQTLLSLLNTALGTSMNLEDILTIGSRIVTLKRLFNLKCGLHPQEDTLPSLFSQPLPDHVTDDFVPNLELQLDDYYSYRRWNRKTGRPTAEALQELGLDY